MPHTPGPWSVSCIRTRESGEPVLQILGADGKAYAQVFYSDKKPGEHAASYADANLIAAAPDLLAELKNLVECLELAARNDDLPLPFAGYGRQHIERARSAIIMATGDATV